jgi:hypothetical protein
MKKGQVSDKALLAREGQLEFLLDLYERDVPLPDEDVQLLLRHGYIKPKLAERPTEGITDRNPVSVGTKSYTQQKADQYVDVIEGGELPIEIDHDKRHIILDNETYDKLSETSLFSYEGGKDITKADWAPADKIYHTKDFVNWINSINNGFQTMVRYKPFAMYCQQADDWLNDGVSLASFDTYSEKEEYARSEMERCQENTLYFMDKYLQLKEGDMVGGSRKYLSKPVHKVICYLVDCGYSLMMGKPRQIAATSTLGGIATAKMILNRNFFIKFITMDKDSGIEIFEDKIKFPFGELPNWMKPEVSNDRDNLFRLSKSTGSKGTKGGVNSKLQVVAPSASAINGGSPQLVMVDEAGYINILGRMIKEARPTMFMMNDQTGKLEMTRQIVIWGTGGEMDKGGKAYETEFYDALDHWNEGNFEHGIIPMFFDWTTRPGITKEFYEKEKRVYTVEGPDKEAKMVQFRQTYPSIIEDMFLTSQKLLVGIDWINAQQERIKNSEHKYRPVKGYFEPIYDMTQPADEHSDVPYKITGATFVALDDLKDDMNRASVEIILQPKKGWRNRYYQGTDPIMSDNGYSNMASVIYDARHNTIVAILNYRDPNHHYTFLQTMLLGLYYDVEQKGGVPELVESNIGTAYMDYKEAKGYGNSLVHRLELPDHMQGGGNLYGIDNRGNRNRFIITKLYEVLEAYGDRFYFNVPFRQLRTFACKISDKGNETWGVTDPRKFHDDVLFALVFSYICASSYSHREPFDASKDGRVFTTKYVNVRDGNGMLRRVPKRVRV